MKSHTRLVLFCGVLILLALVSLGARDRVSVRVTPATPSTQALAGFAGQANAVGSWFGRALPDDPANSPFPEVVMTPTFFEDGNLIANDSHELTNPHATAHGSWTYVLGRKVHAVFLWLNLSPDLQNVPNGFVGTFKIVLDGAISASDPDSMLGSLHGYFYPPGMDPLDLNATPVDIGTFTIQELRRIRPR